MSPRSKQASSRDRTARGPFNVIFVSFDTLRRDHLHAYGHPKPLSPVVDGLAARGVIFRDALVNCGWTLPQHMTMLTGLTPLTHRLIYLEKPCCLAARFRTLAEIFAGQGYLTFGLANQNGYGGGWQYGFPRGFRSYTDLFPWNNAMELMVEPAIQCLRLAGGRPFFMYLHTNDTHEPFAPSEPFGSRWGSSYQNRYEGEISYVDHHLGLILKELDRLEQADRTLIVVTSDHGTEFREHGFLEKKLNLYEEIVQIPLILTLPGLLPEGREVFGLCQTADIAPTLLDICGLPRPKEMDGRSLLPRISDRKARAPRVVFAHTLHENLFFYEHFSARTERHKFVRTVPLFTGRDQLYDDTAPRFRRLAAVAELRDGVWRELYDLKQDPGEQTNIIARRPGLAQSLERSLDTWIRRCGYQARRSRLEAIS